MFPTLATAKGLCQGRQDARDDLSFILLLGERNLVVVAQTEGGMRLVWKAPSGSAARFPHPMLNPRLTG